MSNSKALEAEPMSNSKALQAVGVHHKMLEVMRLVNYIQKDKRNAFHNYAYASDEAIKRAVHEAMVAIGLVFLASVISIEREKGLGKTGGESLTTVKIRYSFTDPDSGTSVTGEFYGTGCDSMDKGLYKAITGALKYALTSTFLIPTGDDPEQDSKEDRKGYKEAGKQAAAEVRDRKIAEMHTTAPGQTLWASEDGPETPTVREIPDGDIAEDPIPPATQAPSVQPGPAKHDPGAPLTPDRFREANRITSAIQVPRISKKRMDQFQAAKKAIGEESYRRILTSHGYQKSNYVPDEAAAKVILAEMGKLAKALELERAAQESDSVSLLCHRRDSGCELPLANTIAAIIKELGTPLAECNMALQVQRKDGWSWPQIYTALQSVAQERRKGAL